MKTQELFKTYPVALIAGGAIIIFSALGFWRSSAASDLQETVTNREADANRFEANVHNALKLDAQLEQMDSINKRIAARLSNPTDVATNQQYFYKLEADSGVKLLDLHQVIVAKNTRKAGANTFYSTLTYSLSVQGDYKHVLGFLRGLESGSKLSVITTASLTMPNSGKNEELGASAPLVLLATIDVLATL